MKFNGSLLFSKLTDQTIPAWLSEVRAGVRGWSKRGDREFSCYSLVVNSAVEAICIMTIVSFAFARIC